MTKISVKQYGRYYNIDCNKGESPKNALERAVALKKLGKPYSGPAEAKKHLPKIKKIEVKKEPKEEKDAITHDKRKTKEKKDRKSSRRVQERHTKK